MSASGHTAAPTRWQTASAIVALVSFVAAATALFELNRLVWREFITPHVNLVNCVPQAGVILRHRVDDGGMGSNAFALPRAVYQYDVGGQTFESPLIRHPDYIRSNAEEGDVGEVRFYGADRRQRAEAYLQQYPVGRKVTVWVSPSQPGEAMLVRQELDISPFLLGLIPGIFVPFFWMFFVLSLHTFVGSPDSRWAAFGWAALSLAGLVPLFRQYQQLAGDPSDYFSRLQNVGMGLAVVILLASLAMRPFRSTMAVGLILSFTVCGGLGTAIAAAIGSHNLIVVWPADPGGVFTRSMECALVFGTIIGLLLGIGASLGFVTIRPIESDSCVNQRPG